MKTYADGIRDAVKALRDARDEVFRKGAIGGDWDTATLRWAADTIEAALLTEAEATTATASEPAVCRCRAVLRRSTHHEDCPANKPIGETR